MIKKRIIISGILTVVALFLTLKFWLNFSPLNFSMNIQSDAEQPASIIVILNRKNDSVFSKTYQAVSKFDFSKTSKFNINFDRKTPPKRLKLTLYNLQPNKEYKISDIAFKNGKYPLGDLSKFQSENARLSVKNNYLSLIPQDTYVTLLYQDKLNVYRPVKFDLKMFLIITILSYLLFYKLTSYLADFKINKNTSRLDILFLVVCSVILFFPMSHINQDEISVKENRTLAKWHPLITNDDKINFNFGKDYDKWFSDRFWLRNEIVELSFSTRYFLTSTYLEKKSFFLNKKTHWMGCKTDVTSKKDIESKEFRDEFVSNIEKLKIYCKENNIKHFYVLLVPTKEDIYYDQLMPFITKPDSREAAYEFIKYVKDKTGVEIIFLYDDLKEVASKEMVFFKTDHHWTDYGAFLGYQKIMQQVKKDYPNIYINNEDDFDYTYSKKVRVEPTRGFYEGITYGAMGLKDKKIFDTEYKYFYHKNSKNLKTDEEICFQDTAYCLYRYEYDKRAPNLVLFGDSFTLNLLPTIVYSFNKTQNVYMWSYNWSLLKYQQEVKSVSPDILIVCFNSFQKMLWLFKAEEDK